LGDPFHLYGRRVVEIDILECEWVPLEESKMNRINKAWETVVIVGFTLATIVAVLLALWITDVI